MEVWEYMMVASCSDGSIRFGGENGSEVTKNTVGVVVVLFDLLATFFFWCSLLAMKKFQDVVQAEVNGDVVLPQDFTVQIYVNSHKENYKDMPGVYYAWVENILQKEGDKMINPNTGMGDENENFVWNVNMASTDTGNLEYMR